MLDGLKDVLLCAGDIFYSILSIKKRGIAPNVIVYRKPHKSRQKAACGENPCGSMGSANNKFLGWQLFGLHPVVCRRWQLTCLQSTAAFAWPRSHTHSLPCGFSCTNSAPCAASVVNKSSRPPGNCGLKKPDLVAPYLGTCVEVTPRLAA